MRRVMVMLAAVSLLVLTVFAEEMVVQAEAGTPGQITKLIPQTGTSKSFRLMTTGEVEVLVRFYRPDVFRILAAPKTDWKQEFVTNSVSTVVTTNQVAGGIFAADTVRVETNTVVSVTTNRFYAVDYSDPLNKPEKAQILTENAVEDTSRVIFEDGKDAVTFRTTAVVLRVNKANGLFSAMTADGEPLFAETAPLSVSTNGTVQTLATDDDTFYYGGGQQNGYFSHKGRSIGILADGNWDEGGHPNPAPFMMSNKGYGILRHTFAMGVYDFTGKDAVTLTHDENRFDAFYFIGDSFGRIIDLYTQFTGRPNFLPVWGLELGEADAYMTRDAKQAVLPERNTADLKFRDPKQETDGSFTETTPDVIARVAEKYRANDMPGGWLLVNDGYGCGHMQLGYVVKTLAGLGFHTGLWTEGALDLIRWEVGTAGTRVQKIDVAWSGPAYQHALNCNRDAFNGIVENSDARAFVWTVQGWAGTQRYGICWTGDQYGSWDLIRYHIPTLIGSGLSGQAYATTDVDGIFGGSPETYTRDLQWKCFTPAMYVMNGWSHMNKSPWAYDEPYRSINRDWLKRKLRLTPYMYAYARNAWDTGAPIVRGLMWNYPNDRKTWDASTQYQFMLGDHFLVAPVYSGMKLNKGWYRNGIYLPAGTWYDYNDGRRVTGATTLDAYPITLATLPIFVRAGAIIPMYPEALYSTQVQKDTVTFDIYPGGTSAFTLYEDDGNTRAYQNGECAWQTITCAAPPAGMSGVIDITVGPSVGDYDGKYETRIYAFDVHSQTKPTRVLVDGEELLAISDVTNAPAIFNNSPQCWYYAADEKFGTVHIKLARRDTGETVSVRLCAPSATLAATPAYPVPPVTDDLDKENFVVTVSSEQNSGMGKALVDANEYTTWHSAWTRKDQPMTFPYTVDIDVGELAPMNSIALTPRPEIPEADKFCNGWIKEYAIYVSRNGVNYGKPIATGSLPRPEPYDATLPRAKQLPKPQIVRFPTTWGRFLRVEALSSHNGKPYASLAEVDITKDRDAAPLPDTTAYLSDLTPTTQKGVVVMNKGILNTSIIVDRTTWAKGITVKAGAELVYAMDGTWEHLVGHVGMERDADPAARVTFRVFADDAMIFERAGMKGSDVKQLLNVDIPVTAKTIRLVFTSDTGDVSVSGVWTDVHFVQSGSGK